MSRLFLRTMMAAALCAAGAAMGSAPDPQPLPVFGHWPLAMAVSPNGRYLATAGGFADVVNLHDRKTGKTRRLKPVGTQQYMDYRMSCYAIAFSPDSRTLVNGGAEFGAYNAINTWDIASGSHLKTFAFTTVGSSIAFTPDGAKIVAPDKDGRVHIWNARTGQALKTIPGPGGSITTLAVSPDGRRVAIGTVVPACFLQMRDLRSGRALWTKTITGEGMVSSLAFSPDGATLARGGQENRIYLHNVRTGSVRATLSDPVPTELKSWAGSDAAQTVKYSPDGRFLAGGAPERVVVWSARTNKVALRPKHAATPFAFMADSRSLAAAQSDVPLLRPAGPHSFTTQPARHDGRIALWSLK